MKPFQIALCAIFIFGFSFVPDICHAQWLRGAPALASVLCDDLLYIDNMYGLPIQQGRRYIGYLETNIPLLIKGFVTEDCFRVVDLACLPIGFTTRQVLKGFFPLRFTDTTPVKQSYVISCTAFPDDRQFVPQYIDLPMTERQFQQYNFTQSVPKTIPIPQPTPGIITQWTTYLTVLQTLVLKYASALTIIAVATIIAAAIAAIPTTGGFSLAGAIASIVVILVGYSSQFTHDEKEQFDEIRNEIAQVDVDPMQIEIDYLNQRILIDDMQITVIPDASKTKVQIESPTACTQGHINSTGQLINDGGC